MEDQLGHSDADFRGDDGRGNLGGIPATHDLRDPQLHGPAEESSALDHGQNDRCARHWFGQSGMNSDRGLTVPAWLVTPLPGHADPSFIGAPSLVLLHS